MEQFQLILVLLKFHLCMKFSFVLLDFFLKFLLFFLKCVFLIPFKKFDYFRYLNDNSFTGPIPSQIGSLKDLKFLYDFLLVFFLKVFLFYIFSLFGYFRYLNENSFGGTIPTQIGKLNLYNMSDFFRFF